MKYIMVANAGNNSVLREKKDVDKLYSAVKDITGFCHKCFIFELESGIVWFEWNDEEEPIDRKEQFNPYKLREMEEIDWKLYEYAMRWHREE